MIPDNDVKDLELFKYALQEDVLGLMKVYLLVFNKPFGDWDQLLAKCKQSEVDPRTLLALSVQSAGGVDAATLSGQYSMTVRILCTEDEVEVMGKIKEALEPLESDIIQPEKGKILKLGD